MGKVWIGLNKGVENISDLVRNEIHGIFNTKNPKKEQIWNYNAWCGDGLYITEGLALKIMHCRVSTPKQLNLDLN